MSAPGRPGVGLWLLLGLIVSSPSPALAVAPTDLGIAGLPLVLTKDGWARYEARSSDGPTDVVIRVGAAGSAGGRAGHWVVLEFNIPSTGRALFALLIAGETFQAKNVLDVRADFPGATGKQRKMASPSVPANAVEVKLTPVGHHPEVHGGKTIDVVEYDSGGLGKVGWSSSVPGLGFVSTPGAAGLKLLAFGVGGDPWKGARPVVAPSRAPASSPLPPK